MRRITLNIDESKYSLFLKFLKTLDYINIIENDSVSISKESSENQIFQRYDFSDLVGKLQWKGDPLKEQRKLRDEW